MKLFVPGADDAQSLEAFLGSCEHAEEAFGKKANRERAVQALRYRHNGNDCMIEVGKVEKRYPEDGVVLVIIDLGDLFVAYASEREKRHEGPALIGRGDLLASPIYFDPIATEGAGAAP